MSRLLVIDDDRAAVDALRLLLEMDGYQVAAFSSPVAALAELRKDHIDLVITDLEMPDVHGLELVRAARSVGKPVLVVTAYSGSPAAAAASQLGALDVLAKPVEYEHLLAAVAAALKA